MRPKCEWCERIKETQERFECYLINDDGYATSVKDHVVQTVIAKYCPVCGMPLVGLYHESIGEGGE